MSLVLLHIGVDLLNLFTPARTAGVCNAVSPYSSTLSLSGVLSACTMHGLSRGQDSCCNLLSIAAGIPLAAAIKFSRSGNLLYWFHGNKNGWKDLTSHPIAQKGKYIFRRCIHFLIK